ncbi:NAD(P)-dependent dehydrogenase (short-subunit alcohol dehydrogenase family) [Advenella incenata]|uniref:NAD(P)-dependent dehydrogenase (Short-subunit alcohol dehydrogenase family) n=1 Tax=Advenella incenata TaxID=267800 RepID=A0A4Q7VEW0_9BURK|nr:SDR family oxidoreductase [Advenella incenata]RZT94837.1 NAD(P)-dependent dehydrogenase (short-subunit alcohol dehydrogenase family) [Advenella incenata]
MENKLIFVTGASRGIGAMIALVLAERGFEVGCLSRSGDLPQVGDVSDAISARWHPVACDVMDETALAAAMTWLRENLQMSIRGLVNNAGLHTEEPTIDLPMDEFRRLMDINAVAVLRASQLVYPLLKENGGGLIVNIGSFYDKLGVKRNVSYCASKAAVGAITRCLAVEWARDGIQVINVAPGYIATDLNREAMESGPLRAYLEKRIPRKSPGDARDVAVLVSSLFHDGLQFLSGETIYLDGAQSVSV